MGLQKDFEHLKRLAAEMYAMASLVAFSDSALARTSHPRNGVPANRARSYSTILDLPLAVGKTARKHFVP